MPRDWSVLASRRLVVALWPALCLCAGANGSGCSPATKADAPQAPARLKAMQINGRPAPPNQGAKPPAPLKSFPR